MNKFCKGKTIGIFAVSLAAISLAGVGFSAWVINGTTGGSTGDITVNVADVQDKRVQISEAKVTDGQIKFDSNSTTGGILSGDGQNEDLFFTISYTVKNYTITNKFTIYAYFSTESSAKFKDVVDKGLITLPTGIGDGTTTGVTITKGNGVLTFDGTKAPTSNSDITTTIPETAIGDTYTVNQVFKFGWGKAFAYKNPCEVTSTDDIYDYEKTNESLKGNVDTLKKNLSYLKNEIGTNASFKLTLSADIKS